MSMPVKSGAGLPISTTKAEAAKASAANKAKLCFMVQFSLVDDIQGKRRRWLGFGSKKSLRCAVERVQNNFAVAGWQLQRRRLRQHLRRRTQIFRINQNQRHARAAILGDFLGDCRR